ncbi:MAG: stage V sporulation protein AD [Bacillota bacterium]
MKKGTIFFKNPIYIMDTATIAGPKEAEGPLCKYFDKTISDDLLGQKSHEEAEIKMHESVIKYLLNKTNLQEDDIDLALSGDLMDEIVGSNYAMRELSMPFFGIYNACATFGEALILGSLALESQHMNNIICSTTSHFSTAERQYRFPLELGNQRTPLSQWTATGAGATLLNTKSGKVKIESATIGRVIDYGLTDANDMGAAMAPAAYDTMLRHFKDTGRSPNYYDLIVTGDLAETGSKLLRILMKQENIVLGNNYNDCGILLYNRMAQKVEQGGSGAACNNLVFNSYIYKSMLKNKYNKVLLLPTGALMSKTIGLQGESVPTICHAVSFERVKG